MAQFSWAACGEALTLAKPLWRLMACATSGMRAHLPVWTYLNGTFYTQTAKGLAAEIRTAPVVEAARRAAPMAKLAEAEMKFLMGLLAGASGAGFAAVVGTEVLGFMLENHNNFSVWKRQLGLILEARDSLKRYSPTLYDKLFNAVLDRVWADFKANLPESITLDTVSFAIGVVIGSAGKNAAAAKFAWWRVIVVVLEQIVVRFSLNVVPQAIQITSEEYKKLSEEIISNLRRIGASIQQGDIQNIADEVKRHPAGPRGGQEGVTTCLRKRFRSE